MSCKICGKGFDYTQKIGEPDLTECPTCGKRVARETTNLVTTPRIMRKRSIREAKEAGFTVLKRGEGGEFEKQ